MAIGRDWPWMALLSGKLFPNGVRLEFLAEAGTLPMEQPQSCHTQIMGSFNRKVAGGKSTHSMARIMVGKNIFKITRKTLDKGLAKCSQFRLYKQQLIGVSCGYRTINCGHG
jgi:hypothetical protein